MKKLLQKHIPIKYFLIFFLFITGCKATFFKSNETINIEKTIRIKYNAQLLSDNNAQEFKGFIDLNISDSTVHISAISPKMGIEVFRINIIKDSVLLINRINKNYYIDNLPNYLSIENIQDILLGSRFNNETNFTNFAIRDSSILLDDKRLKEFFIEYPEKQFSIHMNYISWFEKLKFLKTYTILIRYPKNSMKIMMEYYNFESGSGSPVLLKRPVTYKKCKIAKEIFY